MTTTPRPLFSTLRFDPRRARARFTLLTALLLASTLVGACGGERTTEAPASSATRPSTPEPPEPAAPPRHRGIAPRELGAPIAISDADRAAATELVAAGVRASGWTLYGGSDGYFVTDVSAIPAATLQPRLLWLARTSDQVNVVVTALSKLGSLASSDTDWPEANEALLLGLITSPDPQIASAATATAQSALRGSAAVGALLREACTEHTHETVRATACESVRRRAPSLAEDAAGLGALVRSVTDESPIVQHAALSGISGLMWSEHLPAGAFDACAEAHASSPGMIESLALAAMVQYVTSNSAATDAQRVRVRELAGAGLADVNPWVRANASSQVFALRMVPAHLPRLRELLDDDDALLAEIPFRRLVVDGDTGEVPFGSSMSSGFPRSTVGTWVLYQLTHFVTASRIAPEHRAALSDRGNEATTRSEVLAWLDTHPEQIAASAL